MIKAMHTEKEAMESLLIPNASGILVEPDFLLEKAQDNFKNQDIKIEAHNKARRDEIRAPIPNVRVPFSSVMVKAVRPKMINTLADMKMINIAIEGDERFQREARTMVRAIYDEQEIVAVGKNVSELGEFKVGDLVKIDFRRFMALRDTNTASPDGQYSKEIDVPISTVEGHEYIIIDQRDIRWIFNENKQLEDLKGYEDEVI
jgi:hypothetical protein